MIRRRPILAAGLAAPFAARAQGRAGSLTGIPYAHKDIFCTRGVRTTCGSRILHNFDPPYDAAVAEKVLAAGAVLLARAPRPRIPRTVWLSLLVAATIVAQPAPASPSAGKPQWPNIHSQLKKILARMPALSQVPEPDRISALLAPKRR